MHSVALVSVVIPCRNYGHFLRESTGSVLAQTHAQIETIVVDYGSTDDTYQVASAYPQVRLLQMPDRGIGPARHEGLSASPGEFVLFLDADDRLLPDAIASLVACLVAHP